MFNVIYYKTKPKSLSQAKKFYKIVNISKTATKKLYIIADILMQKKIRI